MARTCHNCPYNGKADEHCLSCAIHARGDSPMRGRVRPVPPLMLENMPDEYEDEEQYSERAAIADAKARLVAFFEAWLKIAIEEQLRRPPGIDAAICAALMVNGGDIQDAARRCEVTYWRCARARARLMANPTIAEVLKATEGVKA